MPPTSDEYWKVHAQLRAPTECGWGSMNDAWLSKLERIQNPQLYSLFEHWSGRLESVARDTGSLHMLATTDSGERAIFQTERYLIDGHHLDINAWMHLL